MSAVSTPTAHDNSSKTRSEPENEKHPPAVDRGVSLVAWGERLLHSAGDDFTDTPHTLTDTARRHTLRCSDVL